MPRNGRLLPILANRFKDRLTIVAHLVAFSIHDPGTWCASSTLQGVQCVVSSPSPP